jgi:hypothetical protein
MRISVKVERLVIRGNVTVRADVYRSHFISALETGLVHNTSAHATKGSPIVAQTSSMRIRAGAGADAAGAATARAIGSALGGRGSR